MWKAVHKLTHLSKIIRKPILVDFNLSLHQSALKRLPRKQVSFDFKKNSVQLYDNVYLYRLNKFAMIMLLLLIF